MNMIPIKSAYVAMKSISTLIIFIFLDGIYIDVVAGNFWIKIHLFKQSSIKVRYNYINM